MTRASLIALAAAAFVAGAGMAQAAPAVKERIAKAGQPASEAAPTDVSSRKRKVRRTRRTSTGTARGREDSPTINTGTKRGQERSGVTKY